jgi:hypothetical protein
MKHKYVKNFKHLLAMVNQVIAKHYQHLTEEEFKEMFKHGDKIYYDLVYSKEYCDQYTWLIFNGHPELVENQILVTEYFKYERERYFMGRNYNKHQVELSDELKDK